MTIMMASCISLARKLFTCRRGAFVASLKAFLARGTTLNLPQVACHHTCNITQPSRRCTQTSSAALLWQVLLHTGATTLVTHLSTVKKSIISMRSSMTPTAEQAIVRLMCALVCSNAGYLSSSSVLNSNVAPHTNVQQLFVCLT